MTIPARPPALHQGPASACVIGGNKLGWKNCTPTSMAMGINRATLSVKRPSGCDMRRLTKDVKDGTTLAQNAYVSRTHYGVTFEMHGGSNLSTPAHGGARLKAGCGIVLQGNAGVLLGTRYQSTNGPVNHAVWLNEGRGWDGNIPAEVLVYDPAADGRRGLADSPDWWPWALVLKFAAALEPNGDGTARLGPGRWYCAISPDTEPHVHLKWGATRTAKFPDRMRAIGKVAVHSAPQTASPVLRTLANNALFIAYQKSKAGSIVAGSTVWYGDHDGMAWVPESKVSHKGGST